MKFFLIMIIFIPTYLLAGETTVSDGAFDQSEPEAEVAKSLPTCQLATVDSKDLRGRKVYGDRGEGHPMSHGTFIGKNARGSFIVEFKSGEREIFSRHGVGIKQGCNKDYSFCVGDEVEELKKEGTRVATIRAIFSPHISLGGASLLAIAGDDYLDFVRLNKLKVIKKSCAKPTH